jgi:hypothetical protein
MGCGGAVMVHDSGATISLTCEDHRNQTGLGEKPDLSCHGQTRLVLPRIDRVVRSNAAVAPSRWRYATV